MPALDASVPVLVPFAVAHAWHDIVEHAKGGLLGRDEALEMAAIDNQPHMEALADFAKLTGFNLEEVLTRINAIDKLY